MSKLAIRRACIVAAMVTPVAAGLAVQASAHPAPPAAITVRNTDVSPSARPSTITPRPAAAQDITIINLPLDRPTPVLATTAGAPAVASAEQVLVVNIAAGAITWSPRQARVTLTRRGHGGTFRGSLGPLTITDARGSLAGWALTAAVVDVPAGVHVQVNPGGATAVTGRVGEALSPPKDHVVELEPTTLMFAPAGGGGGIFSTTAGVVAQGPRTGPDHVAVTFAINVAT